MIGSRRTSRAGPPPDWAKPASRRRPRERRQRHRPGAGRRHTDVQRLAGSLPDPYRPNAQLVNFTRRRRPGARALLRRMLPGRRDRRPEAARALAGQRSMRRPARGGRATAKRGRLGRSEAMMRSISVASSRVAARSPERRPRPTLRGAVSVSPRHPTSCFIPISNIGRRARHTRRSSPSFATPTARPSPSTAPTSRPTARPRPRCPSRG